MPLHYNVSKSQLLVLYKNVVSYSKHSNLAEVKQLSDGCLFDGFAQPKLLPLSRTIIPEMTLKPENYILNVLLHLLACRIFYVIIITHTKKKIKIWNNDSCRAYF